MRMARFMALVLAIALGFGAMATPVAGAATHAKIHHAKVRHARSAEIKAKTPDLKAELLSLSDLPAGWSVTHKPSATSTRSTTSTEPACLAKTKKLTGSKAKATVSYVTGTSVPAMFEDLAYFPKGAKRAMVTFARDLDSCGPISFTSGGTPLTGTIGAMSFPAIAGQSAAWLMALTGTSSGISITVGADIVAFRTGDTVGLIVYENLGSPQVTTVENYARQAAAKATNTPSVPIPKKPTKAVPTTTSTSGAPSLAAVTIAPVMGGTAKPSLSPGIAGKLDVIFTGTPEATSTTTVPFILWNGTSRTLSTVDVAGSASINGSIVGSGNSQDVEPTDVAPGQAVLGMVYFGHAVPSGAAVSLSATSKFGTSSNEASVQVTQANYVAGNTTGTSATVAGAVTNTGSATVDSPISVSIYCFTGSALTAVARDFVSGTANLAPGASGSFSTSVPASCKTFLVGASGHVTSR